MPTILVTGAAGFIGSHVTQKLTERGDTVIGIDNFNDYYDVTLKRARIKHFCSKAEVIEADVSDYDALEKIFKQHKIDQVCHLAAQAGVGYSLKNPFSYEKANNLGSMNLFEICRLNNVKSIIYASSSSVYGGNKKIPFSVEDSVDQPISVYAATKKFNELLAHTYHHLYDIHLTGLRFFTVYGPWGRPDMAAFKFTKAIFKGDPIPLYNQGKMRRDFTFISDIVAGVISALDKNYPYEVFNLGNNSPVDLSVFVECIEKNIGKKAEKDLLPMQPGDVPATWADIDKSKKMLGFEPKVSIQEGLKAFVDWYRDYHKIN